MEDEIKMIVKNEICELVEKPNENLNILIFFELNSSKGLVSLSSY
jgi:hypothetical protein